jgi:hypothetical protein
LTFLFLLVSMQKMKKKRITLLMSWTISSMRYLMRW